MWVKHASLNNIKPITRTSRWNVKLLLQLQTWHLQNPTPNSVWVSEMLWSLRFVCDTYMWTEDELTQVRHFLDGPSLLVWRVGWARLNQINQGLEMVGSKIQDLYWSCKSTNTISTHATSAQRNLSKLLKVSLQHLLPRKYPRYPDVSQWRGGH